MFATSSTSKDYHLMQADNEQTVCGLAVAPVIVDRPIKTAYLHLTSEPPSGKGCCQRCDSSGLEPLGRSTLSLGQRH